MSATVTQSQTSKDMAPPVCPAPVVLNTSTPSSSTLTVTNTAPIMSTKAMSIPKPCPMTLTSPPQLIPGRPQVEEPPNPMETPAAVAPVFPCPKCVGFFFTLEAMKNHLEAEHRKFQCDICRKLMSHKRNVDRHRKSVHENQRGFGCPMCTYKSAHKQVNICFIFLESVFCKILAVE